MRTGCVQHANAVAVHSHLHVRQGLRAKTTQVCGAMSLGGRVWLVGAGCGWPHPYADRRLQAHSEHSAVTLHILVSLCVRHIAKLFNASSSAHCIVCFMKPVRASVCVPSFMRELRGIPLTPTAAQAQMVDHGFKCELVEKISTKVMGWCVSGSGTTRDCCVFVRPESAYPVLKSFTVRPWHPQIWNPVADVWVG